MRLFVCLYENKPEDRCGLPALILVLFFNREALDKSELVLLNEESVCV